jgi:hypothetical protein
MSRTKDKPRLPILKGWAYTHARYFADFLCDPDTPKHLSEAVKFAAEEMSILTGVELPESAPTPKAWKATRQVYIDMRRVFIAACEKAGFGHRSFDNPKPDDHTIVGVLYYTAISLERLLHIYWFSDEHPEPTSDYYRKTYPRPNPVNSRQCTQKVKKMRDIRLLIEEFGQTRVTRAADERMVAYEKAVMDAMKGIADVNLREFIKGTHLRVVLTPTITKR